MYPVPNFPGYTVDEQGNVYNKNGSVLKPYKKDKTSKRLKLHLSVNGCKTAIALARIVLSAKLGRELESFEDACHINGDPSDDRMVNLKAADRLNNIIDDIESGRIETTEEYRDLAVKRLLALDF
jgi:uncharacterized membrane protein YjjP (DUF1212 family)